MLGDAAKDRREQLAIKYGVYYLIARPFRLIGRRIKKGNSHLTAKSRPRDFFLFLTRCASTIQFGSMHTLEHNAAGLHGGQDDLRQKGLLLEGDSRKRGGVDLEQVSRVFALNLLQQHTFFLLSPRLPDRRRDSLYFAIN